MKHAWKNPIAPWSSIVVRRAPYALRFRDTLDVIKSDVRGGCLHCGEKDPRCLDFHHRNPADKYFNVSAAHKLQCEADEITDEVRKCDVLCSNCHRKVTRAVL